LRDVKVPYPTSAEGSAGFPPLLKIFGTAATLHPTCVQLSTDIDCRQLLSPAKEAVRGRDQFKQRVQGFLKKSRGSGEPPKTKEELEKEIAKYDYSNLKTEAGTALNAAARVNSTYNRERKDGGKKVGRVAQQFVHSFSEFLSVYSGIVNIMKGAGQIYGEVAYETLSVLFIVRLPNCSVMDRR
jgi:hypothetical protein